MYNININKNNNFNIDYEEKLMPNISKFSDKQSFVICKTHIPTYTHRRDAFLKTQYLYNRDCY